MGLVEGDAPGALRGAVDGDRAVHLLLFDLDPAAIQQDLGGQVAGRVEAFRVDALLGDPGGVDGLFAGDQGAELAGEAHDLVELRAVLGRDLDAARRGVLLALADLELLDVEGTPKVHDEVQELGQHHRVDDVPLQQEGLRMRHPPIPSADHPLILAGYGRGDRLVDRLPEPLGLRPGVACVQD